MSKKSRRRNKRLLALAGLAGAAALASRRNKAALASTEDGKGGIDTITKAKQAMTSDAAYSPKIASPKNTVVNTPTTIMDSMPAAPKKNPLSKRIRTGTNEVYTIKGGNTGTGNSKSLFIGDDGSYTQGNRTFPNKMSYMNRDKKPAMLGLKSGGRAGLKSGGKVRGCGIAKRGLGRAMKKGKR